jgi:hypothetical protein
MPNNPKPKFPKIDKKLGPHFGAGAIGTFAAAYAPEIGAAVKRGAKKAKKAIKKTVSNIKSKSANRRTADGVVKRKK